MMPYKCKWKQNQGQQWLLCFLQFLSSYLTWVYWLIALTARTTHSVEVAHCPRIKARDERCGLTEISWWMFRGAAPSKCSCDVEALKLEPPECREWMLPFGGANGHGSRLYCWDKPRCAERCNFSTSVPKIRTWPDNLIKKIKAPQRCWSVSCPGLF